MECNFKIDGNRLVCQRDGCGRRVPLRLVADPARHRAQCRVGRKTPGYGARLRAYLAALGRWIASGFLTRTRHEREQLLTICQACEHFKPYPANKSPSGTCKLCGCGCSAQGVLRNKLAMRTEHCPLEKW
jgi:hypothetical protein